MSGAVIWLCGCRRPPEPEATELDEPLDPCVCSDPVAKPYRFNPTNGKLERAPHPTPIEPTPDVAQRLVQLGLEGS